MRKKKSTKTSYKGTRHSPARQGMRNRGLVSNFTQIKTDEESQLLMKLSYIDHKCAQSKNSLEIAHLERSAFTLTTNLKLSIILWYFEHSYAMKKFMTLENTVALQKIRKTCAKKHESMRDLWQRNQNQVHKGSTKHIKHDHSWSHPLQTLNIRCSWTWIHLRLSFANPRNLTILSDVTSII